MGPFFSDFLASFELFLGSWKTRKWTPFACFEPSSFSVLDARLFQKGPEKGAQNSPKVRNKFSKKGSQNSPFFSIFYEKRGLISGGSRQTRSAFFSLKNQDFVLVSVRYGVYRLDPKK